MHSFKIKVICLAVAGCFVAINVQSAVHATKCANATALGGCDSIPLWEPEHIEAAHSSTTGQMVLVTRLRLSDATAMPTPVGAGFKEVLKAYGVR